MNDVVVDTNVWMHANQKEDPHFTDALLFVAQLQASTTRLCLDGKESDEEGLPVESKILGEYKLTFLDAGQQIGATVVSAMLSSGRIRRIKLKHVSRTARDWATQNIAKKSDRPFLMVATTSKSKVLVTHDDDDFDPFTCTEIKRKFDVEICDAERGSELLATT